MLLVLCSCMHGLIQLLLSGNGFYSSCAAIGCELHVPAGVCMLNVIAGAKQPDMLGSSCLGHGLSSCGGACHPFLQKRDCKSQVAPLALHPLDAECHRRMQSSLACCTRCMQNAIARAKRPNVLHPCTLLGAAGEMMAPAVGSSPLAYVTVSR